MKSSSLCLTAVGVALASPWGCGSVVIDPQETASTSSGGGGLAGGGGAKAGAGGATTGSGGAMTGSGGSGGACTGTCPSCTPFAPWGVALTAAAQATEPASWTIAAPDGSVIVETFQSTDTTFGPNHLTKLDPGGNVVWDIDGAQVVNVAPDGACGAFLVGAVSQGDTTVLGIPLACSAHDCALVGRVDATGAPLWLQVHDPGPGGYAAAFDVGVAADGHVTVAGDFHGTLDFGSGTIESPDHDVQYVSALSADGAGLWIRRIENLSSGPMVAYGAPDGLAASSAGGVAVSGKLGPQIDFGYGPIPGPAGPGHTSSYVASYDPYGNLRFGKVFGDAASDPKGWSLALDAAGDVVMAGAVHGAIDLGGGPVGVAGTTAVVVARLDFLGNHVWSRVLAGAALPSQPWTTVPGFAVDAAGHVWIGGAAGAVLELDASGALAATHAVGGAGHVYTGVAGFGPGGAPIVVGTFDGTVDLGQGPLGAGGETSTFVGVLGL